MPEFWKTLSVEDFASSKLVFPQPDIYFVIKNNYEIIKREGVTDESLKRYFTACFNDIIDKYDLHKIWVCVVCTKLGRPIADFGDKPSTCPLGHSKIYEVATFQARSSKVNKAFQHACYHLLLENYKIQLLQNYDRRRSYDFGITDNIVIDVAGSPDYLVNSGSRSKLDRPGMRRSDTEKKDYQNAYKWLRKNPRGSFYILTNGLPDSPTERRRRKVPILIDVTKADELNKFIDQVRRA
jgi:hypothetical protein